MVGDFPSGSHCAIGVVQLRCALQVLTLDDVVSRRRRGIEEAREGRLGPHVPLNALREYIVSKPTDVGYRLGACRLA